MTDANTATTLSARCWTHGPRLYRYDKKTDRFRCPVQGCEAFVNAEVVVEVRR